MKKKDFDAKKTFGLSVLLKLTRKSVEGIEISESNGRYTSNMGTEELVRAVTRTMEAHNIRLRLE
ncbi:MAG: hypothetical protein HUN04_19975 [Desulfobacter sp.]|nr:MAG: hypothetical protein HUN04_19975 [Desulfobacter sp.]